MTWAPNFQFWEPEGLPKIFLRQQPWVGMDNCYNHKGGKANVTLHPGGRGTGIYGLHVYRYVPL